MVGYSPLRRRSIASRAGLAVWFLIVFGGLTTVSYGQETKAVPQTAPGRLAEAKLKVCQAREKTIQKRSDQIVKLAMTMQKNFDVKASRVETYYATKIVPGGKSVSNYDPLVDTLVGEIATKKTAVTTALAKSQATTSAFSCTIDDPKAQLKQFRTDMQAVKKALHEYRLAIKDLISAVRSVTGETPNTSPATQSTSNP